MGETDVRGRLTQSVQAVLKQIFGGKPKLYAEEYAVHFGLKIDGLYRTSVSFDLIERLPATSDQSAVYGIEVLFVFADHLGNELNFADTDDRDRRELFEELRDGIKWGNLTVQASGDQIEVGLYRIIGTSVEDLQKAQAGKLDSELLTAVYELIREYGRLCPIMISYIRGEITSFRYIAELTNPAARTRPL